MALFSMAIAFPDDPVVWPLPAAALDVVQFVSAFCGPDWVVWAKAVEPASAVRAIAMTMDFIIIPFRKTWLKKCGSRANVSSSALVPARELRGTGPIGHHRA